MRSQNEIVINFLKSIINLLQYTNVNTLETNTIAIEKCNVQKQQLMVNKTTQSEIIMQPRICTTAALSSACG